MTDFPRLIEHAFPLKETSLDSVHEKNVRHGHISTLHIWPARRPLAACRAAIIATLLPDPGTAEGRKALCERIAGKVVKKVERKKMPNGQIVERIKEQTEGGILRWIESEPDRKNKKKWNDWRARRDHFEAEMRIFHKLIREAYAGRAPKILDPFSGGGAIPLEAMRLGCETAAVDINPVAWFILKCTLEHPQKLAGQSRPLPEFILHDDSFMAEFFAKANGYGKAETKAALKRLHDHLKKKPKWNQKPNQASFQFQQARDDNANELQADLAWHVRAWGQWVLDRARRKLAHYYPTYADFEPITKDHLAYEHQPMRLIPLRDDGTTDIESLNKEFTDDYLADKRNPRWVAKVPMAYLWARTVACKNCRAAVPLLKTRWLCKKSNKRVLMTMEPNADRTGVVFGINSSVTIRGGNAAQKREHDKRISAGTMSRAGAQCPCCSAIMTMEDIRAEAAAQRSGTQLMVVVTEGPGTKEYRSATSLEKAQIDDTATLAYELTSRLERLSIDCDFAPFSTRSISAQLYGVRKWRDLFSHRQTVALAQIGLAVHDAASELALCADDEWSGGIIDYLCLSVDRLLCFTCVNACWKPDADSLNWAFSRFSISLLWDYAESQPLGTSAGSFIRCANRIASALDGLLCSMKGAGPGRAVNRSAEKYGEDEVYDLIITDPPYYQSVSYADLSDFSYVWLRGVHPSLLAEFEPVLTNKVGEFVQHIRDDKDRVAEKTKYEDQMRTAFEAARKHLADDGRFVCVFAHKEPDAWETLANAIIRAGFVVTGSWPIQTEMPTRQRGAGVAALASSVWMVCRPRAATAKAGWDHAVLDEMKQRIGSQLREFWDAGIRGPDFVWAATGPAMEAYSKHPAVRKANEPNATMGVGEFLNHVRRMVVDYIVGQVLTGEQGADMAAADRLDEVSAYYLLHRHDFGLDDAPVGACILYATACGLSDSELDKTWDILSHAGSDSSTADEDDSDTAEDGDAEPAEDTGGGSKVKLKAWNQRRNKSMGHEAPEGKAVPLIDRIHRVMHLWKDGDVQKVDEFLDQHALRRNELFKRVVQSLIELSTSSERSLLESISNHIGAKGAIKDRGPLLPFGEDE